MDFFDETNSNNTSAGYTYSSSNDYTEYSNPDQFVGTTPITDENTLFSRVFKWMFIGLGISAVSAFAGSSLIMNGILTSGMLFGLIILELIIVIAFSMGLQKMSANTAKICFIAYSIVNGLTLSTILLIYTSSSVFSTFIAAAAIFGGAALYGKTTQKDLTSMGTFLIMGLFGIIVASIINIFIQSGPFSMLISLIGIALFIGITAWDVQKIRAFAQQEGLYNEDSVSKVVIWGALQLYLDFINIFLKLLRFMGKNKD